MKIPVLPFYNVLAELLYALITGGECIGQERLEVSAAPVSLSPPAGALYALILCEADPTLPDKSKVLRYGLFSAPDALQGFPLGELGVTEIRGEKNLAGFRALSISPLHTHVLQIFYFA